MQGGSVQGIGWALNEEYYMSADGAMMNSSFLDYRMPTSSRPADDRHGDRRSAQSRPSLRRARRGRSHIVPPPAAIANAIYHAVGVRMRRLPMNPPAIMEAIWKKQA